MRSLDARADSEQLVAKKILVKAAERRQGIAGVRGVLFMVFALAVSIRLD
jgi:hypothetical protein